MATELMVSTPQIVAEIKEMAALPVLNRGVARVVPLAVAVAVAARRETLPAAALAALALREVAAVMVVTILAVPLPITPMVLGKIPAVASSYLVVAAVPVGPAAVVAVAVPAAAAAVAAAAAAAAAKVLRLE